MVLATRGFAACRGVASRRRFLARTVPGALLTVVVPTRAERPAASILTAGGLRPGLILVHGEDGWLPGRRWRPLRMLERRPDQGAADRPVVSFCGCRTRVSHRFAVSCRGSGLGICLIASRAIIFAHPIEWILLVAIITKPKSDDDDVARGRPAREPYAGVASGWPEAALGT
jgi:hypothetical protein